MAQTPLVPIPSPESPVASSGELSLCLLTQLAGVMLKLPVACGLVVCPFSSWSYAEKPPQDTWASLQGDCECTAPNKQEGLEQQLPYDHDGL